MPVGQGVEELERQRIVKQSQLHDARAAKAEAVRRWAPFCRGGRPTPFSVHRYHNARIDRAKDELDQTALDLKEAVSQLEAARVGRRRSEVSGVLQNDVTVSGVRFKTRPGGKGASGGGDHE